MDNSLRDVIDRYGPMAALIAVIVLLAVVMPGNVKDRPGGRGNEQVLNVGDSGLPVAGADGGGLDGTVDGTVGGDGAAVPGAGGTAGGGASRGGAAAGPNLTGGAVTQPQEGKYPCRAIDGRQAGIGFSMPPCAQYDGNGNGGGTARGVSANQVKVAYYVPRADAATQAALKAAGVSDEQNDIDRIMEVYRRYWNNHAQTYGREITLTKINASGGLGDDVAAKADAKRIADAGFFAVLTAGGTTANATFDRNVAKNGVICVVCQSTRDTGFYEETKGYMFGSLPPLREYYETLGEYMGKRLKGKQAKWAGAPRIGDVDLRQQPRKFGLIWLNSVQGTVDPGTRVERDYFINRILPRWGITGDQIIDSNYDYDITKGPTTAQTVIAKMNTEHVTTILIVGDALTPVFFTREATKQQYHPEWLISGTGLIDTTFFGRTYDQAQWARAYGISPLWVFWENLRVSDGYREYHHYCPVFLPGEECRPGKEGIGVNTYRAGFIYLSVGISGAGPNLTPQSFAQAMYRYPATGGFSNLPLIKFLPDSPQAIKDFTEVFWDVNRRGKDEVSTEGQGILMKVAGGKRYTRGSWPANDPVVFTNGGGEVFTSDKPYTDPATRRTHEEDGHKHDPKQKCLSCTH